MIRAARLAAAVLPLLGLGALWVESERTYNTGTDWEVPIMGYDPRDYLRGHYVEFQYDWPGIDERGWDIIPAGLCLEGKPPQVLAVKTIGESDPCGTPLRGDREPAYGFSDLMSGRLYIGQARAAQLEEQLRNRDQRGIVTIRQREDGSFTPIAIRFRPLNPAEIAERDAPPRLLEPAAPPIMEKQN